VNYARRTAAKLIILVPPTPSSEDAVHQMTIAAQRIEWTPWFPLILPLFQLGIYQPDELHLNSEGAQLFTSAFGSFPSADRGS